MLESHHLANKTLGEERVIVSNIAGTTRDAIDSNLKMNMENIFYRHSRC